MSREYPCIYYDHGKCNKYSTDGATSYCVMGPCSHETPSNADRIRAMSDEELVVWLKEFCFCADACPGAKDHLCQTFDCRKQMLDWLKQPYGGTNHD